MEDLIQRGHLLGASSSQLLTAPEAERIIESLQKFSVEDVGGAKWLEQQGWVDKLNLQAHQNAQAHADEFVKDLLISFDRVSTLVHELLLIEVWKDKLLPFLKKHIAKKVDSVTSYLLIVHEANLTKLLEIVLFHDQAIEVIEEDYLLELVDWCHRQLQYLNTDAYKDAQFVERSAQELMEQTPVEELDEKLKEVRFATAMSSLSITRYLTDAVPSLPIGVVSRLLQTNDTMMSVLPMAENPPWVRKRKGQTELYEGNTWRTLAPSDRFKICIPQAQVWLSLNNLIVDPKCRAKYDMDDFRKESVLRLRRFMNDLLFDQLPVLKDLQRALDELSLNCNPNMEGFGKSRLILEQVATVREGMLRRDDWEALAKRLKKSTFGPGSRNLGEERLKSLLQSFEFIADMTPAADENATQGNNASTAPCSQQPPVKVALYRRLNGSMQPWSDFELKVDQTQAPDPIELQGEGGAVVRGQRWKLQPLAIDATSPLPANGRIAACHGDRSAEALLELPAPALKSAAELASVPAGLWLTVGLLAQDGFALQLRLKRTDAPKERDRAAGVWYVYHAVGGAITVLTAAARAPAAAPAPAVKSFGLMELD